MLANPESEYKDTFSSSQKKEFMFHVLSLVSVGGAACQADENFDVIRKATKDLYKDLVQVEKDDKGVMNITSAVYQIDPSGMNPLLFSIPSFHNKCYAIFKKDGQVTIVYFPFKPFW